MSNIYDSIENLKEHLQAEEKDKLKIALFGQPGAGKSSLINAIVGEPLAETGASTNSTVEAEFYPYGDILLVDLPGYGTSKFPPNKWMSTFRPKDFDLFLCVFAGKFHEADSTFFAELMNEHRVCLFVRNKHDDLWDEHKSVEELEQEIVDDVERHFGKNKKVYFTSCKDETGLAELANGINEALGPAKGAKYQKSAKARTAEHLEEKREACKKMIARYAGLAAANGLNPVPGVNLSVDVGVMIRLFAKIRQAYGLTDTKVHNLAPRLAPLGSKVLSYATKEGLLLLLKKFATRGSVDQLARYVPFVGQAVAAVTGFGVTLAAGNYYLGDCHELAKAIMEEELLKEVTT